MCFVNKCGQEPNSTERGNLTDMADNQPQIFSLSLSANIYTGLSASHKTPTNLCPKGSHTFVYTEVQGKSVSLNISVGCGQKLFPVGGLSVAASTAGTSLESLREIGSR